MEKDGLNGRLSCVKNEMTHLWGTSFLMGGGAFSLMLTNHSFIGYFWGTIGIIAATVFFRAYMIWRDETMKFVEQLRRVK